MISTILKLFLNFILDPNIIDMMLCYLVYFPGIVTNFINAVFYIIIVFI